MLVVNLQVMMSVPSEMLTCLSLFLHFGQEQLALGGGPPGGCGPVVFVMLVLCTSHIGALQHFILLACVSALCRFVALCHS
jgi:hypothetical protein